MGESTIGSKVSFFMIEQIPEIREAILVDKNWPEIAEHAKQEYMVETEESRKLDMARVM